MPPFNPPDLSKLPVLLLASLLLCQIACTPTVKVAADKPITINLNVNIQHEIRIKVDKDLEDAMAKNSALF
jgi:hypothetical protein